jgi:hypothetical protein
MAVYTVHVPASSSSERGSLERAVFLRDGFSWGAFLFGPLWLAWRKAWLVALLWAIFLAALAGLGAALDLDQFGIGTLGLAAAVVLGFEGSRLVAWSLERRGYAEAALQVADTIDEAEEVFFASLRSNASSAAGPRMSAASPGGGRAPQVIGGLEDLRP